jgi:hypothetical protein
MFFPHCRAAMDAKLQLLYSRYGLKRPFNKSTYPGITINLGPATVALDHLDFTNGAAMPCAITALGRYNWKQGSHLVLFDLKLIVPFPPGSTIILPLASMRHGNLPIFEGESRMSITQYCAGGLLRHVDYGFKTWAEMTTCEQEQHVASSAGRRQAVFNSYSALPSLLDNHRAVYGF